MNNILIYLLKSTLCISLLYIVFRVVMRKESFFVLNRILLLSIVFTSALIPLFHLPLVIPSPVQIELLPFLTSDETQTLAGSNISIGQPIEQPFSEKLVPVNEANKTTFSRYQLLQYLYLAGLLIALLMLVHGLFSVLLLFRKAKSIRTEGYRLLVIKKEIATFSFGRTVIISQKDYSEHRQPILTHEQAHIQLYHFFDLLLLEIVSIFHWFNPFVYWLIRDMKEIHEFQADDFTLNKGIDATQYQLLIIQKGVGPQRFALANSFNYCQIKKRIAMMNKQKTRKVWNWKVATFLPMLALLLMAFGKRGTNVPEKINLHEKITVESVILDDKTVIDTTNHNFQQFWTTFRKAVIDNDTIEIIQHTKFPLETRGPKDSDPIVKYDRQDFIRVFKKYLNQHSGMRAPNETQFEVIKQIEFINEKVNKYYSVVDNWVRIGNLEFRLINNEWKMTFAYLDYPTIEELKKE